jgi:hypothetical protein
LPGLPALQPGPAQGGVQQIEGAEPFAAENRVFGCLGAGGR